MASGSGGAARAQRGAAEGMAVERELVPAARGHAVEHTRSGVDNFRSYPVAGKENDVRAHSVRRDYAGRAAASVRASSARVLSMILVTSSSSICFWRSARSMMAR